LTNAQSTNATTKANSLAALNTAIHSRINNYYASGNGTGTTQGREPGISAANNLQTMAACEMMVRSIREQRAVRRVELTDL
jgi:hypothetical protein